MSERANVSEWAKEKEDLRADAAVKDPAGDGAVGGDGAQREERERLDLRGSSRAVRASVRAWGTWPGGGVGAGTYAVTRGHECARGGNAEGFARLWCEHRSEGEEDEAVPARRAEMDAPAHGGGAAQGGRRLRRHLLPTRRRGLPFSTLRTMPAKKHASCRSRSHAPTKLTCPKSMRVSCARQPCARELCTR